MYGAPGSGTYALARGKDFADMSHEELHATSVHGNPWERDNALGQIQEMGATMQRNLSGVVPSAHRLKPR